MINLLGSILLDRDYTSLPAIDNSAFSNMDAWAVDLGVYISSTPAELILTNSVNDAGIIRSPNLTPVSINYGSNFRLQFTMDWDGPSGQVVIVTPTLGGFGIPVVIPYQILNNGVSSFTFDFNSGGFTFDGIQITFTDTSGIAHTLKVSAMTITGLDSTTLVGYTAGNVILVYWDHDANNFLVQINAGGVITTKATGPNLGSIDLRAQTTGISIPRDPVPGDKISLRSEYEFCEDINLAQFPFQAFSDFPYFTKFSTPNATQCAVEAGVVCDVHFNAEPIRTQANTKFTNEGQVQLSATGSHGPIRYAREHGNTSGLFENLTNTSGLFTGLYPGIYTFYAVDQYNCYAVINVVIDVLELLLHGPKYRLQYWDIQTHVQTVIEILERGYTGDVIDIYGTDDPIIIQKAAGELNNKFDTIRPTFAEFNMVSQRNLQFQGMFSQDDKKYKLSFQHGAYRWMGFQVPSTFSQGWTPNQVEPLTMKFGDNLARLGDFDFLDENKNPILGDRSLMNIISLILKKTDLNFDILSAVNKYAAGHSTGAADDPLTQTFIECLCFYDEDLNPMKCNEVLDAILKTLGAEIIQNDASWHILEVDGKTLSPIKCRVFDYTGAYLYNGTINLLQEITAPAELLEDIYFAKRDHLLEIIPAYGTMKISHTLKTRTSIFPVSMDQWQVNINGSISHATPYPIPGKMIKGIEFFGLDPDFTEGVGFTGDGYINLYSTIFRVKSLRDAVDVSMKYKVNINEDSSILGVLIGDDGYDNGRASYPLWVRIVWRMYLHVGDQTYFYSTQIGWNQKPQFQDNYIYAQNFPEVDFQDFNVGIVLPEFASVSIADLQFQLKVDGSYARDFNSRAELEAIPTVFKTLEAKVKGMLGILIQDFVFYELRETDDDENASIGVDRTAFETAVFPGRVLPDDYALGNNQVIWERHAVLNTLGYLLTVESIQVQELIVKYLPNKLNPIELETLEFVNNPNYKENLDYPIITGDLPESILSSEIYTNIFKKADGTPTSGWARTDTAETGQVQKILLRSLGNQYNIPTWRFGGSWIGPNIQLITIVKQITPEVDYTIEDSDAFNGGAWSQTGAGQAWILTSPEATVSFDPTHGGNSTVVKQPSELIAGQRIRIAFKLTRTGTINTRIDRFIAVIYKDGAVVQKVTLFDGIQSDGDIVKGVSFTLDGDGDTIGFCIENISSSGDFPNAHYELEYFEGTSVTSIRYYYLNQYSRSDRSNLYRNEMVQLIPAVHDADPTVDDTGGGNTDGDDNGGGVSGRAWSSGFSNGFS